MKQIELSKLLIYFIVRNYCTVILSKNVLNGNVFHIIDGICNLLGEELDPLFLTFLLSVREVTGVMGLEDSRNAFSLFSRGYFGVEAEGEGSGGVPGCVPRVVTDTARGRHVTVRLVMRK